jgi:predicted nucleic acid-binding protein
VLSEATVQKKRLIILDLVLVEVTNAIWKLHHRGLVTLDEARQLLADLLKVSVSANIEPANRLLKPALEIAAKYDRAVYDALFVALCQDLGLPGVTADEPLQKGIQTDFPQIALLRNWVA